MVIYYNKKTGIITGTIAGRVHSSLQLNMWIGDKKETDKVIIEWKPVNEKFEIVEKQVIESYGVDEEGFDYPIYRTIKQKIKTVDYEPDHAQKELIMDFAEGKKDIYSYQLDLETKTFVSLQPTKLRKN